MLEHGVLASSVRQDLSAAKRTLSSLDIWLTADFSRTSLSFSLPSQLLGSTKIEHIQLKVSVVSYDLYQSLHSIFFVRDLTTVNLTRHIPFIQCLDMKQIIKQFHQHGFRRRRQNTKRGEFIETKTLDAFVISHQHLHYPTRREVRTGKPLPLCMLCHSGQARKCLTNDQQFFIVHLRYCDLTALSTRSLLTLITSSAIFPRRLLTKIFDQIIKDLWNNSYYYCCLVRNYLVNPLYAILYLTQNL